MATPPLRAVIDSCVFGQRRWMERIVLAAQAGYLTPLWSPCIVAETSRYLTWLWIRRHGSTRNDAAKRQLAEQARRWFDRMSAVFHVVEDRPPPEPMWAATVRDSADAPIWTTAVRGQARFVVTANLKDGPPAAADGLRQHAAICYIHPADFVRLLDRWADWVDTDRATVTVAGRRSGADDETDDLRGYFQWLVAHLES